MQSDTAVCMQECDIREVFRALAALAQPESFGNRYFRKAVGLFFLVVNYIYMQ